MSERKNFDQRVPVFQPPEGMVNVKLYGLPVAVSVATPGDPIVGNSGITEGQFRQLAGLMNAGEISSFAEIKLKVARGEDVTRELLHLNPHLVEMSFTASKELRASGGVLGKGYEHLIDCAHCHEVLKERISFY